MDPQILREAMLAYEAVYNPELRQELEEKQKFENWVNSLLEEGYDLSEYTWEEMYEAYLEEVPHLKEFFGPGMEKARYGSPERTRQQRLDLGVVKGGGTSGYTISTSDKPKSGESESQWQTRRTQALALADRLNKETGQGKYRKPATTPTGGRGGAERATRQRLDLGVVKGGGTSGYTVSTSDKPKSGESESQWQTRRTQALALADRLNKETGQGKYRKPATQPPAPVAPAAAPGSGGGAGSGGGGGRATTTPTSTPIGKPTAPTSSTPTLPAAERRTPTSDELRAAQGARKSALEAGKSKPEAEKAAVEAGIRRSLPTTGPTPTPEQQKQLNQTGYAPLSSPTAAPKPVAATPAPAPAAAPKPVAATPAASRSTALSQQQIRNRRLNMNMDYNPFDIVLGHLLDEGYADTEEAALAIMTNMSEEWRESIVEMGETLRGREPKTVGKPERPTALPGETYQERQERMKPKLKEAFNIFVNTMISEGISLDRYSWDEIENVFDDLFEAERARKDPEGYESGEGRRDRRNQSREQQLRGRVMDRMSQMDPEKRKKMLAQMRAVGLDV